MKIIPVIDLLDSYAVHARMGDRAHYQRLQSPLCDQGEVLPLIRRLTNQFNFDTLYIADLNAIMKHGDNAAMLESIGLEFPLLNLWVDAGLRNTNTLDALRRRLAPSSMSPVVGSETWQTVLPDAKNSYILSIDRDANGLRDSADIHAAPKTWPRDVILMNLARVGSKQGVDTAQIATYRKAFPKHRFYAAGGVSHYTDLQRLQAVGADGVLLASALHQGLLSASDIGIFS